VVFVGSGFQERVDLLSAIDWTGIDFGLYGAWRGVGPRHRLRQHLKGQEVDNAVAAALYRKARIGLNLFRSSVGHAGKHAARMHGAASLNPRLLELAACGAFTVSEWRPEVGEVFGGSVPTFRDAAGLQSLLREWLPRGADRERRARSLPGRVAGRTFDGMARTVVRDLVKADADGEPWAPLEQRLGVA
jgi:spore maturation protein CgeB